MSAAACRFHFLLHFRDEHAGSGRADLRRIQMLLGQRDLEDNAIYLHLSLRHLQAVANPIEAITVSSPDTIKRSRSVIKR